MSLRHLRIVHRVASGCLPRLYVSPPISALPKHYPFGTPCRFRPYLYNYQAEIAKREYVCKTTMTRVTPLQLLQFFLWYM